METVDAPHPCLLYSAALRPRLLLGRPKRQIDQGLQRAPAPPVRNPLYNPYAAYGEANATWTPPVFNRDGTIVKPAEPATQSDRPEYEFAPWAYGASGGSRYAPPGTF
jgi:hypothetical protein